MRKNDFKDHFEISKNNPQYLQALLQLPNPRIRSTVGTVGLYGTDILIIQVWNGPPPSTTITAVDTNHIRQ
jgi:hypothetical protein